MLLIVFMRVLIVPNYHCFNFKSISIVYNHIQLIWSLKGNFGYMNTDHLRDNLLRNIGLIVLVLALWVNTTEAQDLEPRFMSSMPIGTNLALASYSYSEGNILLDNTLPVENMESKLNTLVTAYVRGFKLFNRLTKIDVVAPYGFANFNANVEGSDTSAYRQGLGDPGLRISMILIGEDPLSSADFLQREKKKFKLATLARVSVPLGNYDDTKLMNMGANRFAFRLGLASSYALTPKLTWELYFNSNFFTENSDFYNGNTLKQKPLLTLQTHFSYEFRPGVWTAVSFGKSHLGQTLLNGVEQENLQKNTRTGIVFSCAIARNQALKVLATTGVTTRYGSDYTTFMLAYQYMWMDKRK